METDTFRFTGFNYNTDTGELFLAYALGDTYDFTEKITFEGQRRTLNAAETSALNKVFRALHLAAGVSYYKAFLSPKIRVETGALTHNEAVFFKDFYIKGLGEFSYRNDITVNPDFKGEAPNVEALSLPLPKQVLVPIGGGKDSVVSTELLKAAGYTPLLFRIGNHKAILDTIAVANLPFISVKRELSPLIFELNKQQNIFNGHIPITGIISFIMVASAIIYGFDTIIMSNERSANVGNTKKDGVVVNHQWSKSIEFENMFSNFVKQNLIADINYFSLLRRYSELAITKQFSEFSEYHSVFTSCNRAFKFEESKRIDHWCGVCDKCRFVYLALAPFCTPQDMVKIFGYDLLNSAENERGYEELLGLAAFKPFECVGEIEESVAALTLLSANPKWQSSYIVKKLFPEVLAKYGDDACQKYIRDAFIKSDFHNIPDEFADVIK